MNFNQFNFENADDDVRIEFLLELSDMLTYLNPPLLDFDQINITNEKDNYGDCFKVFIPHKMNKAINLSISVYLSEVQPIWPK